MADYDFKIILEDFEQGLAPLAHIDDKTFFGGPGHAGKMQADIVSDPKYLLPSPGLANLTNGTQTGVVDQLIRFILEEPTSADTTYAVGTSKLFRLSSTTVLSSNVCSLDQSYTGNNTNVAFGTAATPQSGQQFTPAKTGKICKVTINLGKVGSPTDNVSLAIYDLDGSDHPDNLLGTADNVVAGGAVPAVFGEQEFDFTFANGPVLTGGTQYAIVLTRSGSTDNSNYFAPYGGTGSLYAGGHSLTYNGSVWTIVTGTDMYFIQYTTDTWPKSITDMQEGESIVRVGNNLFVFYNTAVDGNIATMPLDSEVITSNWGSVTDQALENAPHPAATKEDIILFGNGRYVGTYIGGSVNTLDVQKLDFGVDAQVADIVFFSNTWWIAVNYGEGKKSRIFMYEAGALSNILDDEAGLGSQKIGFLFVHNGLLFIAYQDNTTSSFAIGFLNGRAIKPLRYFTGTLPDHRQKCLFKNTILFVSSTALMSCGATVEQISLQISKLADGGYDNLGGIGAPFGTPMVASSDGSTNHRLAKFSGYSTDSNWYSKLYDISDGDRLGRIMKMVVYTKRLGENARADITLEGNQVSGAGVETSTSFSVTGSKTRHKFTSIDLVQLEDFRVKIDSANGSTTNPCPIRKIVILGNYVQD